MIKSYKLSDNVISNDKLSINIHKSDERKESLYDNIKRFSTAAENTGSYSEEIIRILFDGIDLNKLNKNNPNVDVAVVKPIEGVVENREIISIKSSISKTNVIEVLNTSKSIKIESLMSYILYANSNYDITYQNKHFRSLLRSGLDLCIGVNGVDYRKVMNTTLYYLFFKNNKNEEENYFNDIKFIIDLTLNPTKSKDLALLENDLKELYKEYETIGDEEKLEFENRIKEKQKAIGRFNFTLTHGDYKDYNTQVLEKLIALDTPVSLCTVYIKGKGTDDLTCVINKTKAIKLNYFWLQILKVWCDKDYFNSKNEEGKSVTKYLNSSEVIEIFAPSSSEGEKTTTSDAFPIQIEIGIGDFKGKELTIDQKKAKNDDMVDRYQTFSKYIDTDFKSYNKLVNRTVSKIIGDLERDPSKVLKYEEFRKKITGLNKADGSSEINNI
jgi:hypothetical protein